MSVIESKVEARSSSGSRSGRRASVRLVAASPQRVGKSGELISDIRAAILNTARKCRNRRCASAQSHGCVCKKRRSNPRSANVRRRRKQLIPCVFVPVLERMLSNELGGNLQRVATSGHSPLCAARNAVSEIRISKTLFADHVSVPRLKYDSHDIPAKSRASSKATYLHSSNEHISVLDRYGSCNYAHGFPRSAQAVCFYWSSQRRHTSTDDNQVQQVFFLQLVHWMRLSAKENTHVHSIWYTPASIHAWQSPRISSSNARTALWRQGMTPAFILRHYCAFRCFAQRSGVSSSGSRHAAQEAAPQECQIPSTQESASVTEQSDADMPNGMLMLAALLTPLLLDAEPASANQLLTGKTVSLVSF